MPKPSTPGGSGGNLNDTGSSQNLIHGPAQGHDWRRVHLTGVGRGTYATALALFGLTYWREVMANRLLQKVACGSIGTLM